MADQGDRKTVRAFQCRDYLYEIFDRLSDELGCSVDYLINEAMRGYARSHDQVVARLGAEQRAVGSAVAAADGAGRAPHPPVQPASIPQARPTPLLTPMPTRHPTAPPPLPGHRPSDAVSRGVLVLEFNGQDFPVEKGEFIIGRSAKVADLAIRDGNISRRHAAVVFHDGVYFMKDLGSTNGIEFAGQRVESKRIEDGDVYRICDYELRFTYR